MVKRKCTNNDVQNTIQLSFIDSAVICFIEVPFKTCLTRTPCKEHSSYVCCQMVQWFQIRTILKYFLIYIIGSTVKTLYCGGYLGFQIHTNNENFVRDWSSNEYAYTCIYFWNRIGRVMVGVFASSAE